MEVPEKPTKIYVHRQVSSVWQEAATALVSLVVGSLIGLWLVYPNLLAMLGSGDAFIWGYVGNFLIYSLMMLASFGVVFSRWRAARQAAELESRGVDVPAEVLEVWGKENRLNAEFWAAYRYSGGFEGKVELKKKQAAGLHPGDTVTVRQLERDPHIHRVIWDAPKHLSDGKTDRFEKEA